MTFPFQYFIRFCDQKNRNEKMIVQSAPIHALTLFLKQQQYTMIVLIVLHNPSSS